jgi:hypothetical protein
MASCKSIQNSNKIRGYSVRSPKFACQNRVPLFLFDEIIL